MFTRLYGHFRSHIQARRNLQAPGFSFGAFTDAKTQEFDTSGLICRIDRVEVTGGRIAFHGWSTADEIELVSADGRTGVAPGLIRADVAETYGLDPDIGFVLQGGFGNGRFSLVLKRGDESFIHHVAPIPRGRILRNQLGLLLSFPGALLSGRTQYRTFDAPGFAFGDFADAANGTLDADGLVCQIDKVEMRGDRAIFHGWSTADTIELIGAEGKTEAAPALIRTDVAENYGLDPDLGFVLQGAAGNGRFTLKITRGEDSFAHHVAPAPEKRRRRDKPAGAFQRHVLQNRQLDAPGFSFGAFTDAKTQEFDTSGLICRIDRVEVTGGRIAFHGWSTADEIELVSADGQISVRPDLPREDVAENYGLDPDIGFVLQGGFGDGRFTLILKRGDESFIHHVAPFPRGQLLRNRLGMLFSFPGAALSGRIRYRSFDTPGFAFGDFADKTTRTLDTDGLICRIDKVEMRGDRAIFHGWSTADTVELIGAGGKTEAAPALIRTDVAESTGLDPDLGFVLDNAFGDGRFTLKIMRGEHSHIHHVAPEAEKPKHQESRLLRLPGAGFLSRIRGLYQRYARQHRYIESPGFSFGAYSNPKTKALDTAQLTGHVDRAVMRGDKVTLYGWSTAERLTLIGGQGKSITRPGILRQDVADIHKISPRVGFEITETYGNGRFTLVAEAGKQRIEHHVAPISPRLLRRSRRRLSLRFLRALMRAAPDAVKALKSNDLAARERVKEIFGLQTRPEAAPMETRIFADPGAPLPWPDPVPVTIVLPVYNAFSLLPDVLARVMENTDLPWHLIVIEDCSSDAQVRPWLSDWVATQEARTPGRITLLLNDENLGFIRSVNKGFAAAIDRGDHVLLLNSDAFVPEGWARRMLRPILSHEAVASVTPMSNDAEIFSVPAIVKRTVLEPGQGDAIDALAQSFNPEATLSQVPTGVGFCMAINIDFLRQAPEFDTSFGRGYGEEVDWCQKVRKLGGRHLGLPGLFVEHRGGESFGNEEKLKLILKNNQEIARRYPPYDAEVQAFIAADPLITARVALAVAWAASRPGETEEETGFPIYLAHALGGGAEMYLERRIETDLDRSRPSVVIRVGGPERWQVEVVSKAGRVAGMTDDWDFVKRLLAPLKRRHIVYNCAVGDPDPAELPKHLLELKGEEDSIEVLFHDFFPLSPSYTLLDEDGRYRGETGAETDKAHSILRPNGDLVSLAGWRAAWSELMAAADALVVFSNDSYTHVARTYPAFAQKIVLRPHKMLVEVPRLTPVQGTRRVVAVLGNIGFQKGAAVVAELGRMIDEDPDMDLMILGNVDPAYMPPPNVVVHGDYAIKDLPDLVERYSITDWLIPSIWPETFSFTTHEALATGLPVYAFYLGAQGETVAQAENGHTIHFDAESPLASHAVNTLRGETGLVHAGDPGEYTTGGAPSRKAPATDGPATERRNTEDPGSDRPAEVK